MAVGVVDIVVVDVVVVVVVVEVEVVDGVGLEKRTFDCLGFNVVGMSEGEGGESGIDSSKLEGRSWTLGERSP